MALSSNDIIRYVFVLIWMAINVVLFVTTYMNYGETKKYTYLRIIINRGLPFARGAAMVLNFNCMLVLLSMCRNIISLIRSNLNRGCCGHFMKLLDKNITFHKYCAYTICFFTVVHICGHCFNLTNLTQSWLSERSIEEKLSQLDDPWVNPIRDKGHDPVTNLFKTVAGVSGVVITLSLILMVSSATELIRRSYFETFWFTHHLFVIFFIGLLVHGTGDLLRFQTNMDEHDPDICRNVTLWDDPKCQMCKIPPDFSAPGAMTWKFLIGPIILYCSERLLRVWRSFQKVTVLKVIKHPSKVLEIQMKKESFRCEAGQYIFLKCPAISHLEWHPFTLTSAPEESYFSVHIRALGDWTGTLAKEFGADDREMRDISQCPRLAVDGPFGTSSTDVFKYSVVMCIGAGIGVTPFASILKSVWYRHNQGDADLKIKKVYFFWICRDTNAFEWFADLLKHLEIQMAEMSNPDFVDYNIYLTGWDQKLAIQSAMHQGAEDPITHLGSKTLYGRPEWNKIYKNIADKHHETNIGVFFCGPSVLSHVLHKAAKQHSENNNGVKFDFNKENF